MAISCPLLMLVEHILKQLIEAGFLFNLRLVVGDVLNLLNKHSRTQLKNVAMRADLVAAAEKLQMTQVVEGMRFEASETEIQNH